MQKTNLTKRAFNKFLYYKFIAKKSLQILFRNKKTVFLFGSPFHSNMGDQAQTFCIYKWLQHNYPNHKIYTFRLTESFPILLSLLRLTIRKEDILICHSGYHLTDLYHEQDIYCKIIQEFPDFPIIIFPQTINYQRKTNLLNTAKIFNSHPKILLMCRDEHSYETAQKFFTHCKLLLYPDIVTSLIGTKQYKNKREGILFCMRNDIEAFYSPKEIQLLKDSFKNVKIEQTDTTLDIDVKEIYKNREKILNNIFEQYSKYKLVITDRYHGTIFSLIANTPVIVISSADHKLISGVKWFPESFKQYVQFANNLSEAHTLANKLLQDNSFNYELPSYFKEKYYDNLNDQINKLFINE